MLVCAGEKVTSIRESDFATKLNAYFFELLKPSLENVHHAYLIGKTYHNMEP